ncbi:MAG: hypothetical protein MZV70_68840 [Desulfobacterales bacterium]|nr:hypothetical protein [Desulfobacterales bacterium]
MAAPMRGALLRRLATNHHPAGWNSDLHSPRRRESVRLGAGANEGG